MKKIRILEISLITAFALCLVLSVSSFSRTCDEIRSSVLRLHVLANSDDDKDQALKLKIRDAVLAEGADLFGETLSVDNARSKLEPETKRLEDAGKKAAAENGFDYDVKVCVTDEYFATRTYEDVTLPAGQYTAIKVLIGEAEGHNWWCVMFPPLCLPASENDTQLDMYLNEDEVKLVESDPKYEPRFKIIEIYEKIKDKFTNR